MVKKGDTLIEVTLAIGIFSMVAISIVAVMASGTTGAQTALETTLAREEIDAQAEALRFIQTSYIYDKDSDDLRFQNLWHTITENAVKITESDADFLTFTPETCKSLYGDGSETMMNNAFAINTHALGQFTADDLTKVYLSAKEDVDNKVFKQASTYPHIIYSKNNSTIDEKQSLVTNTSAYSNVYSVEGIYVIAVKEADTFNYNPTTIIDAEGIQKKPAFYDFYIRTCWYGTNDNDPSTISTVIRLYDPDSIVEDTTNP